MSLAPGTRVGQYEIRAQLGAGGMGEVYRAHDARLGRDVALKVLHAEVARDAVRLERFTREARAVAALNHPHIVTIYSTEEADGIRFMTMELIEGRALDELIPREGLPVARFLELALPLADALTAAHQKQITHRDLKPGNVMVAADGRLKVLDFGLARVATAAPEQAIDATRAVLTGEGTIVGTMPYMSPEQVEGRALDARSDLFSLGVMFYEMLAGSRPFHGPSSPALISAIMRDVPPPLGEQRADVPEALARLVARCLEKHPEERVQTARDVYNELRHVRRQLESGAGGRSGSGAVAASPEASLWIAVLPFGARSADADTEALAAGLTEDITSGLSRFPALSVVAPQSARSFKDSPLDVRQIAERLGARYVLGGAVRKSASAVRIAAHLVDARSGAHLWTETYDQPLAGTDVFSIQDDVTDRIVATVADKAGVLARSMVQAVRQLPLEQLSARELILRCWMFQWRPMPDEHATTRTALEHHLSRHPDNPHLWAELANFHICEHSLFFNPLPDALGRAMRAARRAIELDPGNQEGWEMAALTSFYLKDEPAMIEASDRAIRLNPRNSNALAWMGNIRTHAGDYDRGCELTARAMTLNPAHPGWYHFAPFNRHFARGEFGDALKAARRVNMPEFMWMHFAVAAAAGQLGHADEGRAAAEAMLRLAPPFAEEATLREFVTRWYWPPELIEGLLEGVARARGATATGAAGRSRSSSESGRATARPPSGPGSSAARDRSIAVVPFAAVSSDPETQALADGLTEDITAGLSRFPYLSVVAAHSSRQHRGSTADARRLGEALGARYLLDGNLRRGGAMLRLTVRLVDTTSGAQLWSETYDRTVSGADLLALQDDLTDRIVATVADAHGVLLRAISQGVEQLRAEQLDPDALLLRYWAYHRQHAPAEHGVLRDAFERLVEERPTHAFAWSALAHLYCHEHGFWFNARPDPLARARKALGRALELDAVDQHGWEALALAYFFERDPEGFAHASDRAIALNPRNANTLAWIGVLTVHTGELDRGCALVERAMTLNPDHPGWYHIAMCNRHLVRGEHAEALRAAKRINMPQHIWAHVVVAVAAGELGRSGEAAGAVDAVVKLAPAMADPAVVAEATRNWKWDDGVAEQMMIGYRKAVALREGSSGRSRPPSSGAPVSAPSSSGTGAADGSTLTGDVPAPAEDLTLAVLLFTAPAGEAAARSLADALTDDITTGLSRFENLRVLSRAASAQMAGAAKATVPGCRYVLDGTVRIAGNAVRVGVRISDVRTSANVWAENFDVQGDSGIFTLQDDLASRIVATVGDPTGVLAKAMRATLADVPLEELGPEALMVRYHAYTEQLVPDEHARLRDALEQLVDRQPGSALGWALLSHLYEHEHSHGLNARPDAIGRQRRAAQRALELDSGSQHVWVSVASAHKFSGDLPALHGAVERAVAINPLNADHLAFCALLISTGGTDERALELARLAMHHKPRHPGWYHFPTFNALYMLGQHEAALAEARLINMPRLVLMHLCWAAAAGQLGRAVDARLALDALAAIDESLLDPARAKAAWRLWITEGPLLDRLVDGVGKALALRSADPATPFTSSGAAQPLQPTSAERPRSGPTASATADRAMRVAVLPFTAPGGEEATALAEGLSDEITTALARFPYLRVASRAAVTALEGRSQDPRAAAATLGARFLLEGSVRTAGSAVRVSARLSDVESGAHLWAETFDREIASGVFALQDDLAGCITSQVADPSGALVRTMASARRAVPLGEMSTSDLTLQFFAHLERFDPAQHAALRDAFERALEREPNDATAWGCLSDLYGQELSPGLNPRPDPLSRQRAAAERAIALDATCQYGWLGLAVNRFYTGDLTGSVQAGQRAIALNPFNTHVLGLSGNGVALAGEWERGLALVRRAIALNPHIAGHVHLAPFLDSYRRGDHEAALASAKRFNMPQLPVGYLAQAAAAGQLGRADDARAAFDALSRIDSALCETSAAREAFARFPLDPALVQHLAEGFQKALALVAAPADADSRATGARLAAPGSPTPQLNTRDARPASDDGTRMKSDEARSRRSADDSGTDLGRGAAFVVAVQPFTARAEDGDATELARGLTGDVTTGLSRFRYLRVRSIAAGGEGHDPHSAGATAGAGFVLDGAVRRSGATFRVSARLTDVATGEHLWADNYDREASSALFALQDDLASRIVATLADGGGVLGRVLVEALRGADPQSANGLFAEWAGYVERFTPDKHAALRDGLEALVARQPDSATAWAYLSILYGHEIFFDFNPRPDPMPRVRHAAERAVTLDPDNQSAWYALAEAEFFERHRAAFGSAAERAIELNPLHSRTLGGIGVFYAYAGDTGRGASLVARAMSLNPRFPGWFHIVPFLDAYWRGDADGALTHAARINMPHLPVGGRLFAIAAAGRFGREREARDGLRLVGESQPELLDAAAARREWSRWIWEGELLDALVDGYATALGMASTTRVPPGVSHEVSRAPGAARPPSSGAVSAAARAADLEMRVAVLPFTARGGEDGTALAEGLTDDIATALARFSYLKVVSRAAVDGLRGAADDARAAGSALRARFLLEGAVRQAGGTVRVSVRLSDVESGAHLWAEAFDRDFAAGVFAVQDDVASRTAATVADSSGVLVRAMATEAKDTALEDLDVDGLVLRYHLLVDHFGAAEHGALRDAVEAAASRQSGSAPAWACLAMLYAIEVFFGLNAKPEALQRLRTAAERANTLDPTLQPGWVAMATAALFDRDRAALQAAVSRALAINPLHTRSLGTLGLLMAFSGDTAGGAALMERSIALNPRHPGWYLLVPFLHAYGRGDFNAALGYARRIGMPKFVAGNLAAAAAAGQVGTVEDARPALDALSRFDPALLDGKAARGVWARWLWNEELIDRLVEGLEKAVALVPAVTPPPQL